MRPLKCVVLYMCLAGLALEVGGLQKPHHCVIDSKWNTHEMMKFLKQRSELGRDCRNVNGKVRIANVSLNTEFFRPLRNIKFIEGSLEITKNNISFIGFDQLEEIQGKGPFGLSITDNPHLLDVGFPQLKKIEFVYKLSCKVMGMLNPKETKLFASNLHESRIIIENNAMLWTKWFKTGKGQIEKRRRSDSIIQSREPYPNSGSLGDYAIWFACIGAPAITILGFFLIWLVSQMSPVSHSKKQYIKSQKQIENFE